jgi:tRNA pseudouridine38-40 synthase
MLRTIKLIIEYDGTDFSGWQSQSVRDPKVWDSPCRQDSKGEGQFQPGLRTVQGTIASVLHQILREKVNLMGASRTDAGVHALGQVAHFCTSSKMTGERLLISLNGLLPRDISICSVTEVRPSFHASLSAKKKTYVYLIWNSLERSAINRHRAWHVWATLNLSQMRKASKCLIGRHDFSAFRAADSDIKTSVRRIDSIAIRRGAACCARPSSGAQQAAPLQITVTGTGFLKHMVRNIVGTLVEIGEGKRKAEEMIAILKSKDRRKAGRTAPAHGLCLVSIVYEGS